MMLLLFAAALAQQAGGPPAQQSGKLPKTTTGPVSPAELRFHGCMGLATSDPHSAETRADEWLMSDGGYLARQCLGVAYANQGRWTDAATTFEKAAQAALAAHDTRAALDLSEAGNAWLAAGDADKAEADLDAALAQGTLDAKQQGEARLDLARALVAKGDLAGARTNLDQALDAVPQDSLAWLLSATLARRMGDLPRAHKDIAAALERAPKAAAVQLEAGNIAAKSGDEAGARAAWQEAVKLDPDSAAGHVATQALLQFETAPPPPAADAASAPAQSR
ncbi:MAG: tetratricopeptide repeat protein [Sphingomonas sp.]